ncbi:MAG: glycosyltransferase [Proteobacteria bacterium]|nr:MAG: glycosyltransferase [Pseudomonadota bacterium]
MWYWAALYFLFGVIFVPLANRAKANAERATPRSPEDSTSYPSVIVIRPVKGTNASTEEAWRSWLSQTYPGKLTYVFSFQDPNDIGISLAKKLYAEADVEILVHAIRDGFSGKASNLHYGVENSESEFLIFSDADMIAKSDTISEIVARARKGSAIVSCLPIHTHPKNLWARLYATVWNSVLVGLWATSMSLKKAPGVAGGTVAFYRSDLDSIGGVAAFSDYVAEDLKMGALFKSKGFEFILGPIIQTKVGKISFTQYWNALMRGAYVSWTSAEVGILRTIGLQLFSYGYAVVLIYGLLWQRDLLPGALAILFLRMLFLSWFNFLAEGKFRLPLMTFFNDVMTLIILVVSICQRQLSWAGVKYKVTHDGRMIKLRDPDSL